MKHLKTFENFGPDMGRFSADDREGDDQDWLNEIKPKTDGFEDDEDEFGNESEEEDDDFIDMEAEEREEEPMKRRVWGDEVVEKKKMNPGFQAYLDKKKGVKKDDKKSDKKEDKKDDKKSDKKDDNKSKGLTAGQKKLPEAMQKAILAKKKK